MNKLPAIAVMAAAALFDIAVAQSDDPTAFARIVEAGGEPAALEVPVMTFRAPSGAEVDLVGAVHVADRAYFAELDRRLSEYPVVLYELVGEPGSVRAPRGASTSMVGLLQGGMKDALGLAFQLEEIDYARDNMVHADLTASEFSDSMRQRGESLVGLMFRAWAIALAEQGGAAGARENAGLLKVLFAEDRQLALKRVLASQLAEQGDLLERLSGRDGSTLIEVRNARALERLAERLDAGAERIAIFYGAGHIPDLAERLVDEFGMRHVGTEWLEAWDLRAN
ncbi:MAG: hypothetical protein ACNS61_04075 [Candidatus Wenzhouxiangella sp. M2_3B_020]